MPADRDSTPKSALRRLVIAVPLLVGSLLACGDGPAEPPPDPPRPTTVLVSPATAHLVAFGETVQLTLALGDTVRLAALPHDADGHELTELEIMWRSSDEAVALVESEGLVTATGGGLVEITGEERVTGLTAVVLLSVAVPRQEPVELYEAFGGTNWTNATNWGTVAPLDTWHGVTTDRHRRIVDLDLSGDAITGGTVAADDPMPSRYLGWKVPALRNPSMVLPTGDWWPGEAGWRECGPTRAPVSIRFSQQSEDAPVCAFPQGPSLLGARATDQIPPELDALRRSGILNLSYNSLTGPILPELGNFKSLRVLDLGWNMPRGSIPEEVASLQGLQMPVDLGSNDLAGAIPPDLGRLQRLEVLAPLGNSVYRTESRHNVGGLTDPIPLELRETQNLHSLFLRVTSLTDRISAGNRKPHKSAERVSLGQRSFRSNPTRTGEPLRHRTGRSAPGSGHIGSCKRTSVFTSAEEVA